MNLDLRDLMASRADAVDPPVLDPLAVVADGERRVRSRRRLTAAGAALALVVTVGTATVVADRGDERLAPSGPIEWAPGTRPLTWGEGQTIHLGDREVDTGMDFLSLDVTDDGAAFTTLDGGIWFTDGSGIEQIGTTQGGIGFTAIRPRDRVVNDSAGSLLAWLEYPTGRSGRTELVVFDSGQGAVLGRAPVENESGVIDGVAAVVGRQVFTWMDFGLTLLRYDLDSDRVDEVRPAVLEAARRGGPRALVVGASAPEDGRLIPDDDYSTIPVDNSRLDQLFVADTGERLDLQVSLGDDTGHANVYFLQWLDDDRFTVGSSGDGSGDLHVCEISAGRCTVTIDSGTWTSNVYPGRKAPLQPGDGGVGAELAMGRAMQAARD